MTNTNTDYSALTEKLIKRGETELSVLADAFELCRDREDHVGSARIRALASRHIKTGGGAAAFELYNKTLLFDARDDFDCFMRYIESGRPLQEQYWFPRRKHLLPVCQALQELEDGQLDELFLAMPPRVGKALANDTPILTRHGWKNHGDLCVGDEVIGLDGSFKRVIAVHPKCSLDVLMKFSNGETIQCHENHEWLLFNRFTRKTYLRETKEYEKYKIDTGTCGKRGHKYKYALPKHGVVKGNNKNLPLDPYTLGVWLGDGATKNPRISMDANDSSVVDRIQKNGHAVRWMTKHKTTGVMYYDFDIRKELQCMNLCHSRKNLPKRIPSEYLTASVDQRLQLLAGLIDTDGTLVKSEGRYQFTTCSETLRDGFISLVSTFGWRTCTTVRQASVSSSGIVGKQKYYTIAFNPDIDIPCALERKQNHEFYGNHAISLVEIKRVDPKEGNCITVEGDGMYLAGKSLIPTHNTTLADFFLTWVMGRNPERSNLYSSYTDSVVGALYNGILEILTDQVTYKYYDVFPKRTLAKTNAKDLLIDLDRKRRYSSFTGRSLYGTLNGACDCNGYLIADDLISGIEEAMNKDRLNAAWMKVDNNLLPRAKETAKILWIGTRWSLTDPQGRRIDLLENDPKYAGRRWKVLNTPALDENDESNFDYLYDVGFTTEYYQQRRASFERNNDIASWLAQYQGEPIERDGAVFSPEDLRYYNGVLPEGQPDRIFMAVDPAWGGGDFVAAPVLYQFKNDLYLHDLVYSNEEKTITQPLVVKAVKSNGVNAMKVEGTKMTASYGEDVGKLLEKAGIRLNMQINTSHFTGNGKRQRIFDKAPDIREHIIFRADGCRSREYAQFMQSLFSFTVTGKAAKHDDAADALAMAIEFAIFDRPREVQVFSRPF